MSQTVADLHLHTHYSDGRAAPQEVVSHAASLGLRYLAISDHDSTQGAREAAPVARELGITLLPAIELTTSWEGDGSPQASGDVDLLGYGVDWDEPRFRAAEETTRGALQRQIKEAIAASCERLTRDGYPITAEEVLARNPRAASPMWLPHALVAKGLCPDVQAANALVARYWSCPIRPPLSLAEGIAAIHAAGGVAVLAHPTMLPCPFEWFAATGVHIAREWGLDGLEVYHPRLDAAAREQYAALAPRYGLLITGGSDEHGWPSGFGRMGSESVTQEIVDALLGRIAR